MVPGGKVAFNTLLAFDTIKMKTSNPHQCNKTLRFFSLVTIEIKFTLEKVFPT